MEETTGNDRTKVFVEQDVERDECVIRPVSKSKVVFLSEIL